jgi:hypothetical protein
MFADSSNNKNNKLASNLRNTWFGFKGNIESDEEFQGADYNSGTNATSRASPWSNVLTLSSSFSATASEKKM